MNNPFTDRDILRLKGVHPDLYNKLGIIFAQMQELGHPMFIVMGVRTAEEQAKLYAQGRTAPGPIVTYKDGVRFKSDHQVRADGFGHAVDSAFVNGDPFSLQQPWDLYGERVEGQGLTWGGRWSHPHDSPHAQLD